MCGSRTAVLIPAYKPDKKLIGVVESVFALRPDVGFVIVDDGSGPDYADVFDALPKPPADGSLVLLHHEVNCGKGEALKTGLRYIYENMPDAGVFVTADADGQHTPADIIRTVDAVYAESAGTDAACADTAGTAESAGAGAPAGKADEPCADGTAGDASTAGKMEQRSGYGALVLGSRLFTGDVPPRSIFGNTLTRFAFATATGVRIRDTQTGLRAARRSLIPILLDVKGSRYEYELNMLLRMTELGIPICEIDIETVYINENASSHFNPVKDSLRIYSMFAKYSAASLVSFFVDFALLFIFRMLFAGIGLGQSSALLFSVVCARVISATVNFVINRMLVFESRETLARSLFKYAALAGVSLGANYCLLWLLNIAAKVPLAAAKIAVEVVLFIANYFAQRLLVFRGRKKI
jgi:glycosyltransferase involved in cell wall biosynthesis